ncbi:GAF domain-containing protein [Caulobacter soli]|uniref:GAF domain-containing protein n=1 Tax=Caulobacter soli TaxID=2708539 RepID=UPI0013E9E92F|nr:GAF domain-containing protein [Caulobacter soli]
MFAAPIDPTQDAQRVAALYRVGILDTPPAVEFDQIAWSAKIMLEAMAGFVAFVDRDRQWFKARAGFETGDVERGITFCNQCIADGAPLWIEDTHLDPRFVANPFVTGAPFVRFYAGAPIRDPDGWLLGTVCAIDTAPRALAPRQLSALVALADMVSAQFEQY